MNRVFRTSLRVFVLSGFVICSATTSHAVPITLSPLSGLVGGSPANTVVFKGDLSGLSSVGLSSLQSITITDNSGLTGGAVGQFSGFDLDAIKISTMNCSDASCAAAAPSVASFNFSAPVLVPGQQREPTDPTLFGTTGGGTSVNNSVATLQSFDGNSTTDATAAGFVSLGDGGGIGASLTSPLATSTPLFLYFGEVGNNGEVAVAQAFGTTAPAPLADTSGDVNTTVTGKFKPAGAPSYFDRDWTARYSLDFTDTVLTITTRIGLTGDTTGLSDPDTNLPGGTNLLSYWKNSIEDIWSNKYFISDSIYKYQIVFDVQLSIGCSGIDQCITVFDDNSQQIDSSHWDRNIQGRTLLDGTTLAQSDQGRIAAHEYGHLIGAYDEYAPELDGAIDPDLLTSPGSILPAGYTLLTGGPPNPPYCWKVSGQNLDSNCFDPALMSNVVELTFARHYDHIRDNFGQLLQNGGLLPPNRSLSIAPAPVVVELSSPLTNFHQVEDLPRTSVPEPPTLLLVVVGLPALLFAMGARSQRGANRAAGRRQAPATK